MENVKTHLLVIGAGPGGYAAAFLAADLGMKVTLVDREPNPGGVCLYRGCIPSKALLHVSHLLDEAQRAREWGIRFGKPKIDLARLRSWKQSVVSKLTGGLGQLSRQRKIRYIQGDARLVDDHSAEVKLAAGGRLSVEYEYAILATGSVPARLPLFATDSPLVMDSTAALELPEIPERLLVVGAGYIGLELGSVYAALGANVTVVELLPELLPAADRDLVRVLQRELEKKFEAILLETVVEKVAIDQDGVTVSFSGKDSPGEKVFDRVLVSVGRQPNTAELGLDRAGVEVDEKGFIQVDAQRRTSKPHIFAIGDVVGGVMLAHKAAHEGQTAVEAIAGKKVAFEPNAIPAVVFTDPELAWCGLTEQEARSRGIKVAVARFPWGASGRATTLGRSDGLTKLIIDPESRHVLGVGIAGPGAGELISEGCLAVEMAALADDLRLTIHPHPTLSETLMEAAAAYFGQATHIFRPARK